MKFRFAAGAMTALTIAAGAAVTPGPAQGPAFQPYSAVRTVETQDSNGKTVSTFYALEERDASGRRLTARLEAPVYGGKLNQVSISDPVKMRMIEINYLARTATVTQFPAAAVDKLLPPGKPFETDDPARTDLGDKRLNGVDVHGYGWTTNDPNPPPIDGPTIVGPAPVASKGTFSMTAYPLAHEAWWSPVLRLFVLSTVRDANGNKQIIQYDQIMAKDPGAADFAIPAGFHVRTLGAGGAR